MHILWVEDKSIDIKGLKDQCDSRDWQIDRKGTFYDGLIALADESRRYNIVVLDTILPSGDIPEDTMSRYSTRIGGKLLLEIMRGTDKGQQLLDKLSIRKDIYLQHSETPVIMLSRIQEDEDDCFELNIVEFFSKSDYTWGSLISTIEAFGKS